MLNLNSIMVGSAQPKVMAEFYEKVFGKPADMVEGDSWGWAVGASYFGVGAHSEVNGPAKEPQRIIMNMETNEIKEEYERIKNTGAKVIKELYEMDSYAGMWIATFSDPDGNYFQLMTTYNPSK